MSDETAQLDIADLQARLRQIARDRDWERFHTPKNLAMALSVEVAELVEIFQWLTPEESIALSDEDVKRVEDELGDIVIYLSRLADVTGVDIGAAVDRKLQRNADRRPSERGWAR